MAGRPSPPWREGPSVARARWPWAPGQAADGHTGPCSSATGHLPWCLRSRHWAAPALDCSAHLLGADSGHRGLGSKPPVAGRARGVAILCKIATSRQEQARAGKPALFSEITFFLLPLHIEQSNDVITPSKVSLDSRVDRPTREQRVLGGDKMARSS